MFLCKLCMDLWTFVSPHSRYAVRVIRVPFAGRCAPPVLCLRVFWVIHALPSRPRSKPFACVSSVGVHVSRVACVWEGPLPLSYIVLILFVIDSRLRLSRAFPWRQTRGVYLHVVFERLSELFIGFSLQHDPHDRVMWMRRMRNSSRDISMSNIALHAKFLKGYLYEQYRVALG